MNLFSKEQLEGMIEQMGLVDVPECEEHRYALRRKLLNSKYFHVHRSVTPRRALLFVPVVAGGFVVVSLAVGMNLHFVSNRSFASAPSVIAETSQTNFSKRGLIATFVDDRPMVPVERFANTVSFSTVATTMRVE